MPALLPPRPELRPCLPQPAPPPSQLPPYRLVPPPRAASPPLCAAAPHPRIACEPPLRFGGAPLRLRPFCALLPRLVRAPRERLVLPPVGVDQLQRERPAGALLRRP